MSTPNVFARRALKRFEDAVRNHEMKGTCHPDEHSHIQERYQNAKRHLMTFLPKSEIGEVVETRGATSDSFEQPFIARAISKRDAERIADHLTRLAAALRSDSADWQAGGIKINAAEFDGQTRTYTLSANLVFTAKDK